MMAQVIVALIRKLTGLKDSGTEEELKQATDIMLKEYFDTSMAEIALTPIERIPEFLIHNKKLHPANADLFADVMIINADKKDDPSSRAQLYERALYLLEWIDKTGGTFSVERQQKMRDLRLKLEKI
jgi:hypothetical protein